MTKKAIIALSAVMMLSACDQPAQTTIKAEPPQDVAQAAVPAPISADPHGCRGIEQWSEEFMLCVTDVTLHLLHEAKVREEKRPTFVAAFTKKMEDDPNTTVSEVIANIPDDLTDLSPSYPLINEDGRLYSGPINDWLEKAFGDWAALEERALLRAHFKKPENVTSLRDSFLARLAYLTFDASARKWFAEGKTVFEKPLAPYPTDGRWYKRIIFADTLPDAPAFWVDAYGKETFSKNSVYWFMFLHRRNREGGPALVQAWQETLVAWLAEVAKRPDVPAPAEKD